jgi:hypothetical protein
VTLIMDVQLGSNWNWHPALARKLAACCHSVTGGPGGIGREAQRHHRDCEKRGCW